MKESLKPERTIDEMLLYRKIEDAILSNLKKVNLVELNILKNSYSWIYYGKNVTDKAIDHQILKTTRRLKLLKIEKIASENDVLDFFPV